MSYKRARVKEKYIPKSVRLMDQVREVLRYHHYSIRTEEVVNLSDLTKPGIQKKWASMRLRDF